MAEADKKTEVLEEEPAADAEGNGKPGPRATLKRRAEELNAARWIALLGAISGLAIAILILSGPVTPEAGLAAAAIGLACLVAIALVMLPPEDLERSVGRVKSLTLGSMGIELADFKKLAKGESEDDESGDGEERDGESDAETLIDLRLRLEAKLTYLAKHVLAHETAAGKKNVPTFLTVGSLRTDKLLSDDKARVADHMLTISAYELKRLGGKERGVFLDGAKTFVGTVRIETFSAWLEQQLRDMGYTVLKNPHAESRRDLLVQTNAETGLQHHAIPVFAVTEKSDLLGSPGRRLAESPQTMAGGSRFLVVPPLSETPRPADLPAPIEIVKPAELFEALKVGAAPGEAG